MYQPEAKFYFAGVGLCEVGCQQAGVKITASYELDAKACAVQRANFQHPVVECDLTQQPVLDSKECDAMVFSWPCTRYSTFGQITETRTGDDLFKDAVRHKYVAAPDMWVAENVPGMKMFPLVMESMIKTRHYHTSMVEVDSALWGLQRRKRLIIFGTKRPFTPRPPVQVEKRRMADVVEANPTINVPAYFRTRLKGGKYRDKPIVTDPRKGDLAPTCVAHYGRDRSTRCVMDHARGDGNAGLRPWTVREYARLQGLPDSFTFGNLDSDSYLQIGNGVDVNVARWFGSEIVRYFNS